MRRVTERTPFADMNAHARQAEDRVASPLQAVSNNQPLRIFGPDRLDEAANDPNISFFRNFGGLIQQIKADPVVWAAFVTLAQHAPMESAGVEGLFIRPQIERFPGRIDAITRRAMQVEIDMDLV